MGDRLTEVRIDGGLNEEDIVTEYRYDLVGNLDLVRLPNCVAAGEACDFSVDYEYDVVNQLEEIEDALGNRVVYAYDSEGNRTREEFLNPGSAIRRFTNFKYDDYNRLEYEYFTETVPPASGSVGTHYEYYNDGMLWQVTDPEGHVTGFEYDSLRRLNAMVQWLTPHVSTGALRTDFESDVRDNVVTVEDPRNFPTEYTNSDLGWTYKVHSVDTVDTWNDYDPAGNLVWTKDSNNLEVYRTYDALNRLLTINYPGSAHDVAYSYDSAAVSFGKGRRTGMIDASGETTYHYDRRGLLTKEEKEIDERVFTTEYAYDATGNLVQLLYPTDDPLRRQGQAEFVRDDADRISSIGATVGGSSTTVATGIQYEPFGPRRLATFGNGLLDARTYPQRYQIGDWTLGDTSDLIDYTHAFDDDGNLSARTDNVVSSNDREFGYDQFHRLTTALGPWGAGTGCSGKTYSYDANGNRTCKGEDTTATAYSIASGWNGVLSSSGGESASYEYDGIGNTTEDGTFVYGYGGDERLGTVHTPSDALVASYVYDGAGRRVEKTVGAETTHFFYDPGGRLLSEMTLADGGGKDYIYLNEEPVARVDWDLSEASLGTVLHIDDDDGGDPPTDIEADWTSYPAGGHEYVIRRKRVDDPHDKTFEGSTVIAVTSDPDRTYDDPVLMDEYDYDYAVFRRTEDLYFYHADHLGTPIAMTGDGGAIKWRAEHRPFGGTYSLNTGVTSPIENNLRFPGQYADAETGLHQNYFRDYDPNIGRYREPDPIGLAAGNPSLFGYAHGSPVNLIDFTGTWAFPWEVLDYVAYQQSSAEFAVAFDTFLTRPGWGTGLNATSTFALATLDAGALLLPAVPAVAGHLQRTARLLGGTCSEVVAARTATGSLRMTETVAGHTADMVTKGPFKGELARPFLNSPLTLREIMADGKGIPDPGGVAGALRWDVPGAFRGAQGTWELVIKDDLILHFNFVGR